MLRKVLSELVASDNAARVLMGLREAADANPITFPPDQRIRAFLTAERPGVMPQLTAVRDAGTGRAFLQVAAGTTSAGAVAVTNAIVTIELVPNMVKADGSSL